MTLAVAFVVLGLMQSTGQAQPAAPSDHQHPPAARVGAQAAAPAHAGQGGAVAARELVQLPPMMREHMLANMRDHLKAVGEIQQALAESAFDRAAAVAEQRLGMSSLALHGASHMAPLMPKPMQDQGTAMHHAASQFAIEAQNAAATADLKPALAALARMSAACVGCHAAYRVQ
jgi:cytochrome c556